MNATDARLKIINTIRDVLLDLADDGTEDVSDEDYLTMEGEFADAADIILEALGFEVASVAADGSIAATLRIVG